MAKGGKSKADLKSQPATSSRELVEPTRPSAASAGKPKVHSARGCNVVLDEDLAPRLGVTTARLNEAVKRNIERFPPDWVFQIEALEFVKLDTNAAKHGGRRKLPWAFTEHGVVMAASVLRSPAAIQAMQFVVEVFIDARKEKEAQQLLPATHVADFKPPTVLGDGLSTKLKGALDRVLDTIIDHKNQVTVREEAQNIMTEAIHSLKERLRKSGAENEELAARAAKLLAEAEQQKAVAAKTRAEADQIEFTTLARKLRLVIEANIAMESGDIRGFLDVLDRLSEG